jgi:hypothetical protein
MMLRILLRRPSPGTVLAFIALVLAMSPLADAGVGGPKRATTARSSSKIPGQAKYADRATNANHATLADNANRLDGFKAAFSPAPNTLIPLDSTGHFPVSAFPQGVQGPPGPPGPQGAPGSVGTERFVFTLGTNPPVSGGSTPDPTKAASAFAACKSNERVVGGGYIDATGATIDPSTGLPKAPPTGAATGYNEVEESAPVQQGDGTTGWFAQMTNIPSGTTAPVAVVVEAWAICRA